MLKPRFCLSLPPLVPKPKTATFCPETASNMNLECGLYEWKLMSRLLPIAIASCLVFSIAAGGQVVPARSGASPPPAIALADDASPAKNTSADAPDPASLLPDLPSLRPAKSTLIGGTVERLDRMQDRITLLVFGGGRMKIMFDPRTRIYRDGDPASASDLHRGDRVYIDTVLDGSRIFALNIRLKSSASVGESRGVVLSYRGDRGELTMRDMLGSVLPPGSSKTVCLCPRVRSPLGA
jgi:hypothetical protein